jgi:hypothetical protein
MFAMIVGTDANVKDNGPLLAAAPAGTMVADTVDIQKTVTRKTTIIPTLSSMRPAATGHLLDPTRMMFTDVHTRLGAVVEDGRICQCLAQNTTVNLHTMIAADLSAFRLETGKVSGTRSKVPLGDTL